MVSSAVTAMITHIYVVEKYLDTFHNQVYNEYIHEYVTRIDTFNASMLSGGFSGNMH
jgi:hypothetical protein